MGTQIGFEIVQLCRSGNGDDIVRTAQNPGQCDLPGACANVLADQFNILDERQIGLKRTLCKTGLGTAGSIVTIARLVVARECACQHAPAKRGISHESRSGLVQSR